MAGRMSRMSKALPNGGSTLCCASRTRRIVHGADMSKRSLYRELVRRIDCSIDQGVYLEASWYIYAALEDRLVSLLRNSGGDIDRKGKTIKMLGPKLVELLDRAASSSLLGSCFAFPKIDDWRMARNNLMHAMAEGAMDIGQIDVASELLARTGRDLMREVAADAMRFKKRVRNT